MGLRFNPPPGWPVPPTGWLPPPGWKPDATWPTAPEGWQFLVDDLQDATPINSTKVESVPPSKQPHANKSSDQLVADLVGQRELSGAVKRRRQLSLALGGLSLAIVGTIAFAAVAGGEQDPVANGPETPVTVIEEAAEPSTSATPPTVPQLIEQARLAAEEDATTTTCAQIRRVIGDATRIAKRHERQTTRVTGLRAAAAFRRQHAWVSNRPQHVSSLTTAMALRIDPQADRAVAGRPDSREETRSVYRLALLDACDLTTGFDRAQEAADAADSAQQIIRKRAARAPWWPPGFTRLTDNIAINGFTPAEYAASGGCDGYAEACIKGYLVARAYCSSVYLQINWLDGSGRVIDWGNHMTGSARRGQRVFYEIYTYSDIDVDDYEITNASCN